VFEPFTAIPIQSQDEKSINPHFSLFDRLITVTPETYTAGGMQADFDQRLKTNG
jgi:hypothetical protein